MQAIRFRRPQRPVISAFLALAIGATVVVGNVDAQAFDTSAPAPEAAVLDEPLVAADLDTPALGADASADPVLGLSAAKPSPDGFDLDHFKCYRVKASQFQPVTVQLKDQFDQQPKPVVVLKPVILCNPVEKLHDDRKFEVRHPKAHLTCYQIRDPQQFAPRNLLLLNQFGDQPARAVRPDLLCVPSTKTHQSPNLDPGANLPLDHFKCYRIETPTFQPQKVELKDQFYGTPAEVGRAFELCNPVQKYHAGKVTEVQHSEAHLTCFALREPGRFQQRTVFTNNQFGPLKLRVLSPFALCAPTIKIHTDPPGGGHGAADDFVQG